MPLWLTDILSRCVEGLELLAPLAALALSGLAVTTSSAGRGRNLRVTAVLLSTAAALALGVVALAWLNRKL